jgi:hypothetical protein
MMKTSCSSGRRSPSCPRNMDVEFPTTTAAHAAPQAGGLPFFGEMIRRGDGFGPAAPQPTYEGTFSEAVVIGHFLSDPGG